MIKIYTSPSCSSCRKVKKWFEEQQIPFEERNIFNAALDPVELKEILFKSENGTEDIISERSKIVKEKKVNVEDMTISEMISFIRENPSVLKRPIVVNDRRIQVGYNEEEIRSFIPQARRIFEKHCNADECPDFNACPHARDCVIDKK
ncbi:MAG TPA: transcriptional regulator Spx [Bacilli bacterium]|jgi:regulatory protein spx|nr:transcriptional regulator Spx [Bacilli bacterium]HNY74573.1 transcriptional regulator Spx [Bacilli bacterium]HOF53780.1 transcriptional regulator Spx [Bacilli bacterium]HOH68191.1 transcriptional regulator Spx [Bacilli bacterium]HOR20919.1 transcriptional regulator Spx [Bacilli bacterium]